MSYLSGFLMVKDESPFLKEWVAFHRTQGYDKFYIYDNNSKIPVENVLKSEINNGIVHVTKWVDDRIGRHVRAMNHCLNRKDISTKWLSLTDIDEFIYGQSLPLIQFLINNESFDCLKFKWKGFGSNGHKNRPSELVIQSYTKRGNFIDLPGGKSIVKFGKILSMKDPHNPGRQYKSNLIHNEVFINHYVTRSEEDWINKCKKGGGNGRPRHMKTFYDVQSKLNKYNDTEILKYLNETIEYLK